MYVYEFLGAAVEQEGFLLSPTHTTPLPSLTRHLPLHIHTPTLCNLPSSWSGLECKI